jgi:hypothetical protein
MKGTAIMESIATNALVEKQDTDVSEPLNQQERETLTSCEKTIAINIQTFVKVGEALRAIRDARLYRESHKTFEAYCRDRWNYGRAHAHRVISASETVKALSPIGDILPTAETQVRPLLQFDLADRPKVWADVRARIVSSHGRCTTRQVSQAIQELIQYSDDELYRRHRAEIRKQQRERRRQAEEREQRNFSKALLTRRQQEAALPDGDLNQLEEIASKLTNALARNKARYEALEIPDRHIVEQMMTTIEVSIKRLANWVGEQEAEKQGLIDRYLQLT